MEAPLEGMKRKVKKKLLGFHFFGKMIIGDKCHRQKKKTDLSEKHLTENVFFPQKSVEKVIS